MNRWMRTASMLGVTLVAASCASHHPFPGNWTVPQQEPGSRCPDISGTYRNAGEAMDGKSGIRLMHRWFGNMNDFPVPPERWKDIGKISIQQNGQDDIRITGLSDVEPLFTKVLTKSAGDFTCRDGWIELEATTLQATSSAFVRTQETRGFARAGGYLIERSAADSFGMMLIVPVGGKGTYWYRYAGAGD